MLSVRGVNGLSGLLRSFDQLCIESRRFNHRFRGHMANRHRDPKWKKYRANQTIRIKLPEYEEARKDRTNMTPEEQRSFMKEKGLVPGRMWVEKPLYISSTPTIVEPYVPPEGDGKTSFLSKAGALQRMKLLEMKGKSRWYLRKIRQFDDDFELDDFAEEAHKIYLDVHNALAERDIKTIEKLVTETCYPDIVANTELKTLRWKFIKSIEPPRVVHIRTQDMISKDNIFAQVTVRLHTQQTLAIYDRYGRLMHGSEAIVKDVLDYVVFEKHMSNEYGKWRLHAKIMPEWQPVKPPHQATTVIREALTEPQSSDAIVTAETSSEAVATAEVSTPPPQQPQQLPQH